MGSHYSYYHQSQGNLREDCVHLEVSSYGFEKKSELEFETRCYASMKYAPSNSTFILVSLFCLSYRVSPSSTLKTVRVWAHL